MTEVEQAPTTNGLPEENEDEEKAKLRPPDIDADMREMEKRKRVEMIMSSRLFREELERIIESQMKEGGGPAGLLQQIQDMVGGASRLQTNLFRGSNCVLPINDIRGVEAMGYAKGEKVLRCKLASVFRLMDLYGWSHGIHNLITGRLSQENEEFLVNPHGLMYHEVTASSLVKVDMQGNVVEKGTTNFGVNSVAFRLHASLHAARPDIKCVVHVRNPPVLAISSLKSGLLPISAESSVIGEVSTHHYIGSATEPEERDKIARSLGPVNKVLLLSNHGALCCGETVEEAFFNVYNTVLACETQVKLMPLGIDNLISLPDEGRKALYDSAHRAPANDKKWRVGGLEFEALMRMLDNAGFRTGYIYRSPLVKGDLPKPRNDVEVPPAVSSLGYLLEEEEMYRQGNWKKGAVNRSDRSRWLNSPNVYQKVEILETGTNDPKKITKWVDANNAEEWVADGSPAHTSTPVKIDAALQFVPKNTNPKEFKKLQQQIKENRRADKITSGPQSHILEGVTWEEAKKLQDANISMTGDQVILVGAASKGIIQRGFQNNATVYKSPYAKNPFDQVSEQELEEYKSVVTRKQKGEYYGDDTEQSESEALSSSAALIKSEQEDTSEPQVLRIETKTAPAPSQAEVVLSDDDLPEPHVERSKSQRYPATKVPDVVKRSSSADRAFKDGGVGQVLKCRLVDSETIAVSKKLSSEPQSVGIEINDRKTLSDEEEPSSSSSGIAVKELSKFSKHDPMVPDLLKANVNHSFEKSKLLEELNAFFKKRMDKEDVNSLTVEEESISLLPVVKCLPLSGSPTGFSSDGTTISLELNSDEANEIKKSINSLEEHIGEDYEATFESDSSICTVPRTPATQFFPDLTADFFKKLYHKGCNIERVNSCEHLLPDHESDFSLERSISCSSLCPERDNVSVCTYVSSPEDISLIGFEDNSDELVDNDELPDSSDENEPDEEEEEEYLNCLTKIYEQKEQKHLKLEGSISVDLNKSIHENTYKRITISLKGTSLNNQANGKRNDVSNHCEEFNTESDSTNSMTSSSPLSEVTVIRYNDTKHMPHQCYNEIPPKIYLDVNQNNASYSSESSPSYQEEYDIPGYDGDLENTFYSPLSFSSINWDASTVSPSGYEADNELTTSFSSPLSGLYTIHEEELSPQY